MGSVNSASITVLPCALQALQLPSPHYKFQQQHSTDSKMKTSALQVTVLLQRKTDLEDDFVTKQQQREEGIFKAASLSPANDHILRFSTADYRILKL